MSLEDIYKEINKKLNKQLMSPRILLDRLRLIDEDSRKSSQYQDPNYLPFYYYLSRFINPKSILNVGFYLGLPCCCFLQGSDSAEKMLGFQRVNKLFYSPRLALSNIKDIKRKKIEIDFYYGNMVDLEFQNKLTQKFDLIMLTEDMTNDQINECLDISWECLNLDGFLVCDYINSNKFIKKIFSSFVKTKNRDAFYFKTRYGVGIIQK